MKMGMMVCVAKKYRNEQDPVEVFITECNECALYNRGECCISGLPMHPEDFCSKAVKAE